MGPWGTEFTEAPEGAAWSELLPRWDELSTSAVADLERHPVHGPELRLLRRADRWLHSRVRRTAPCPSAEELYDFGRGPGHSPLGEERQAAIAAHVVECADCQDLTATLESAPPLPLDLSATVEAPGPARASATRVDAPVVPEAPVVPVAPESSRPEVRNAQPAADAMNSEAPGTAETPAELAPVLSHPRWHRNLRRVAPVAAAAGVLALAMIATRDLDPTLAAGVPSAPLLRGEAGGPLMFPRGRVLADCRFDRAPAFEITPQEGASEYRVVLRRHDGSAFSEGEEVVRLDGAEPVLRASAPLEPGFYTWEAWAVVAGLEESLGSRDFSIVEDEALRQRLAATSGTERVRALHDAEFVTDARHLARSLPDSEFREQYLQLLPGR